MRIFAAAAAMVVLTSCSYFLTSHDQMRGTQEKLDPIELTVLENREDVLNLGRDLGCSDRLLRARSIEEFYDDSEPARTFKVGIIELSDDGHVTDDIQERQVLDMVRDEAAAEKGALIVTFVHGWHHRPKVCDNNLACFRRVLYLLSKAEQKGKGRRVVGVYIGWRGDSWKKPRFVNFYDRKSTAHKIGHDGGREVLLELNEIYERAACRGACGEAPGHRVRMVTVGHSFGGALVFSAMEGVFVRELRKQHVVGREAVVQGGRDVRPLRPGIGDLVVLVNPAFEALRYRWFDADLKTRGHYNPKQLPVLLTVSSEADNAVKWAFPIGRTLYFLVKPWNFRGMSDIIGAGRYDPQITHDLVLTDRKGKPIEHPDRLPTPTDNRTPEQKKAQEKEIKERCALLAEGDLPICECEYTLPDELTTAPEEMITQGSGAVPVNYKDKGKNNEQVMLRIRANWWDPTTPFLVARASADVIPAHSDIYTQRFVSFLVGYISAFVQEAEKEPAPCNKDPLRFNVAPKTEASSNR
ncbi:MAG TPA: hypothetical protein VG323_06905 [Thermoanaerobaculia bacterium]|nr:hypothetical protein [Thermoanaerobaculia bacterium]